MQGINVVVHAIKILFYDVWATVRLTVLPLIIGNGFVFVIVYLLTGDTSLAVAGGAPDVDASFLLATLLAVVVTVFMTCWAAIGWHRYVLLEEQPGALLPKYSGAPLKPYFWAGVRLGLVSVCLLLPVLILIFFLGIGILSTTVLSIFYTAIYAVILRFSFILPGAAIDKPMSLGQSWNATKGQFSTILVVAVLLTVFGLASELVLLFGYARWIISILLGWFGFAFGVSILTTLYGLYVEKREL